MLLPSATAGIVEQGRKLLKTKIVRGKRSKGKRRGGRRWGATGKRRREIGRVRGVLVIVEKRKRREKNSGGGERRRTTGRVLAWRITERGRRE